MKNINMNVVKTCMIYNNILKVYNLVSRTFLASSLATHSLICGNFPLGNRNYSNWLQYNQCMEERKIRRKLRTDQAFALAAGVYVLVQRVKVFFFCKQSLYTLITVGYLINWKNEGLKSGQRVPPKGY